jgi:predicted alpha/beta hydrolase family esterase
VALVDRGSVGGYIWGDYPEWLAGAPRDRGEGGIMMEPRLKMELASAELTLRRARLWRDLARCWLVFGAAVILCLLIQGFSGWTSPVLWIVPLLGGMIATGVVLQRYERRKADFAALVSTIEREYPELRHLLSAAAEQEPDESGFGFLQLRVVDEVLAHPKRHQWRHRLEQKLAAAKTGGLAALAGALALLCALGYGSSRARPVFGSLLAGGVTVTPGDTQLERGSSLVIAARFGGEPPAEASLALVSASGKTRRVALERHLADPVFGASLSEVTEDGHYHVEYPGGATPDYKITVFDYPSLVRADASLVFPAYTGLSNKTIPDTRRISAVEGARLTYTLQLNKPVKRARLVSGDKSLELALQSNAVAVLAAYPLTNSARFTLALEDAEGRFSKFPADFVLQVLTNRRPEVKLVFPRGDQRVSRLEEIQLQGEAGGDFGLIKYGVGYGVAGQNPRLVELGGITPGKQKRSFEYLISLENLDVEEDQVIGYFVWAEDHGPDGKPRRTSSDIFFAEVRPFDEIFRPEQSGMSENENEDRQGRAGGQNPGVKLAELQKEIVIATWKLQQNRSP